MWQCHGSVAVRSKDSGIVTQIIHFPSGLDFVLAAGSYDLNIYVLLFGEIKLDTGTTFYLNGGVYIAPSITNNGTIVP